MHGCTHMLHLHPSAIFISTKTPRKQNQTCKAIGKLHCSLNNSNCTQLRSSRLGKHHPSALRSENSELYDRELGFKDEDNDEDHARKEFELKFSDQDESSDKGYEGSVNGDVKSGKGGSLSEFDGENGDEVGEVNEVQGSVELNLSSDDGRRRQMMRRSSLMAKQVISIYSALSLGFVSQLWVDTNSWVVLLLEVRPTLLSGEAERFLLENVSQVGDVILVKDESAIENDFRMVGLETLVGYRVVTQDRRQLGKVRGFNFDINSGAVESLELDPFGFSIVPSILVSTYALFVEDVVDVIADVVIVHEAAASHIQRLTKGLWDTQRAETSLDELEDYENFEKPMGSMYSREIQRRRRKPRSKIQEAEDDLELPMDYL